jgi:hypothetical protein
MSIAFPQVKSAGKETNPEYSCSEFDFFALKSTRPLMAGFR